MQAAGGAKNHLIIMPDADLDQAVDALQAVGVRLRRRALHGRQSIAVPRRRHRRSHSSTASCDTASKMKVGPTDDGADVDMGPVISRGARDRVASYLDIAQSEGADRRARRPQTFDLPGRRLPARPQRDRSRAAATCASPAKRSSAPSCRSSAPTTSTKPSPSAASASTATAPASSRAAATPPAQFKQHFNAGMIGINIGVPAPMAWFPFTGWNKSFFGDLHIQGTEGDPVLHAAEDDDDALVQIAAERTHDPVWKTNAAAGDYCLLLG